MTINSRVVDNMICYDKNTVKDNWLGFDGADLTTIKKRKEELGISLPPSYRDFLLTTNGFKQISLFAGCLYPIAQIDWTKKKDAELLEIFDKHNDSLVTDDKYFVYGEEQHQNVD